jgi:phage tail-like protein
VDADREHVVTAKDPMGSGALVSTYLQCLPAALRQGPFLGRFLLAFETILSGLPGAPAPTPPLNPGAPQGTVAQHATGKVPGLDQYLDAIGTFFDPMQAPSAFLPWLAGWVATSLSEGWDDATSRAFLSQVMQFYRTRGTKAGITAMLHFFLDAASTSSPVHVLPTDLVVDDFADHRDAGQPPHYFQVSFTIPTNDGLTVARLSRLAIAVIDQQKPAHTFYSLVIAIPRMRIVDRPGEEFPGYPGVIVGRTTGLGTFVDPT